MHRHAPTLSAALALGLAPISASAAIQFNEVLFDAPGGNIGKRFFELRSTTPGESLSDVTLVAIDGDGSASGVIDLAQPFGDVATGANGLALLRDSSTVVLNPAPATETTVVGFDYAYNENTTVTYLLVTGFSSSATTDIDTDNNGTLDSAPWTAVLDALSFRDALTDNIYAAAFGGLTYDESALGGDIGGFVRTPDGGNHAFFAAGPNDASPFTVATSTTLPMGYALTPGGTNNPIPEPASLALLAAGGLLVARRRAAR